MIRSIQKKKGFIGFILLGGIILIWYSNSKKRAYHKDNDCTIERLEQQLFNAKSKEAITALIIKHSLFSKEFLNIKEAEGENAYQKMGETLFALLQDPTMQAIYKESNQQFSNCLAIERALQKAFCKLKRYYPNIKLPKIYTFISGMAFNLYSSNDAIITKVASDLHVSNDLIVIGLDYFLGKNPKFELNHLPKYIANHYNPSSIACKIMLLYTQQFNKIDESDKTLLTDMLYYGKSFFLVKTLLPHTPDYLLLDYEPAQLKEVNKHKTIIWGHFIEHELLYNTKYLTKKNYIGIRPFTGEIGPSCPGSIGKWLGWEIIKKYMKQNKLETINSLMTCTDSEMILRNARYQPKDDK